MKLELKEHTVPKRTAFGKVQRSLNQYYVFVENSDTKRMMLAGYYSMIARVFQPLMGFPRELCNDVCEGIQAWLAENKNQYDKKPEAVEPPPSQKEIDAMQSKPNDEDEDD